MTTNQISTISIFSVIYNPIKRLAGKQKKSIFYNDDVMLNDISVQSYHTCYDCDTFVHGADGEGAIKSYYLFELLAA